MTIHEPEASLVTRRVFQMDDKAQGPAGRFMLMVNRRRVKTESRQMVKTNGKPAGVKPADNVKPADQC